jgi:4-hydroxy-tetrahydrodipicolinate reductase
VKLALHGATGRMGLSITRIARELPDVQIVGAVCATTDPAAGRDIGELAGVGTIGVAATADITGALLGADVMIDFSTAAAVPAVMAAAARERVAVVSGTTNIDDAGKRSLQRAAESVPVLWAPNTSLGVQVLSEVVEHAIRRLGLGYDVEIVEVHHRRKTDAPSGTAKRLAEAARAGRSTLTDLHARSGDVGARTDDELGVLAVRGGDVVGDHTVHVLGHGERLELTHRATSRELFAQGAIRAARVLLGKPPGLYSIRDVLS